VFVTLFFWKGITAGRVCSIFFHVLNFFKNLCTSVCDSMVHMKIGLWTIVRFDAHSMDSKAATHVLR
jgi:hypothetical protein